MSHSHMHNLVSAVICPKCGAAIGSRCFPGKTQLPYHQERYLLATQNRGLDREHSFDRVLAPKIKLGSHPTTRCQQGSHDACSGYHGSKHGMKIRCTCHCGHEAALARIAAKQVDSTSERP